MSGHRWLSRLILALGVVLATSTLAMGLPAHDHDGHEHAERGHLPDELAGHVESATAGSGRTYEDPDLVSVQIGRPRLAVPEDRYALAGGCYTIQPAGGGDFVVAAQGGFATGTQPPEPFHFQATDLGRYLIFAGDETFLAAAEGLVGEAVRPLADTSAGSAVDGLTAGTTDRAAGELARSPLNTATGRGSDVIADDEPSERADWELQQDADGFVLTLPVLGMSLTVDADGRLALTDPDDAARFTFALTDGCAAWPEVEVNVDGPIAGGETPYTEVRGYLDAHLHMMAFEFLGGRARCGQPWHAYGVPFALSGCPEHELADGRLHVLETFLSGRDPVAGHDTNAGWPTFTDWPKYNSLTYEQIYYRWMERAWRGGLRMFVNLLVDNNQLCTVYPLKRNSCNEMDGVRLQAERINELERYIDAQYGGPGRGWFRIVTDPFQARHVMNEGKLAVVLGIEVSRLFDCRVLFDVPLCSTDDIDRALDEVYDLGVRQMELVNKFDNALSGVTGDAGETGVVVNTGNFLETGRFWQMETCDEDDDHGHDKPQLNFADDSPAPDELVGRDALAGQILQATGASGVAPLYPEGPHCSTRGLTGLGEHLLHRMIDKGMIFDPDHMSGLARSQALDLLEAEGYSGVVSSHSWADDGIYRRVYDLGGVVTPYAGRSSSFADTWDEHRTWVGDRYYFGFGYGADTNGFGSQGAPRGADVADPVEYPFTGFGGATIHRQVSGERTYDINTDGVAHYGLYPDWVEDLRKLRGEAIIGDLERGPEAYLQMWERALGVANSACHDPSVTPPARADLEAIPPGTSYVDVLFAVGQPDSRIGDTFTYCVAEGPTAVIFDPDGRLLRVEDA